MRFRPTLFAILAMAVTAPSASLAQERLRHEYTNYTDANGRLYMNKHLPLYVWISSSPDPNAPKTRLRSESSPQYSNPFYFDTEGYNTLRTPSQVDTVTKQVILPKQDIIFEVYSDGLAPKSTLDYGSGTLTQVNGKWYAGGELSLEVKASDAVSGVAKRYVSLDGEPFREASGPTPMTKEGDHVIRYYSVDNVGNPEAIQAKEISFDLSPPTTEVVLERSSFENVISPRTRLLLAANDNFTGIKSTMFRWDEGPWQPYWNYIPVEGVSEGEHTLHFYSVDKVNNPEQHKSMVLFMDKSAPIVVDEVLGSQFISNGRGYSSGRTKFKLTAVDNKAGVEQIFYSLNGAEFQVYDQPFYLPSRSGGVRITFYAVDKVGNSGNSSAQNNRATMTYVDLTGPDLAFTYQGPQFKTRDTVFINQNTQLLLKATDIESGVNRVSYTIDEGAETTYNLPFNVQAEGRHIVNYTGYDNVDNSNRSNFFFIVDNTPPEVYHRFSILPIGHETIDGREVELYPSHVVLFLPATDAQVGFDRTTYSVNGGAEKPYPRFIEGFAKNTVYHVRARVFDKLGNEAVLDVHFKTLD